MVAAVNGKVYSIEQNAQTGTTLTMELGNGYQAVYGQLTDLTVSEGDTLKKERRSDILHSQQNITAQKEPIFILQ